MPLVAAATSLSRTVASARPGRLRTRLRPYHSDDGDEHQTDVPEPLQRPERHAQDHQRVRARVREAEAEQAEGRHGDAAVAAGDPGRVLQHVLAEEDQPQAREPEVDPPHPPADRAEQRTGQPRQQHGADQRQQRRQPEARGPVNAGHLLPGEEAVAVGADGDEERVGERELARGPDQDREPDRRDDRRHGEQPRLQPEALEVDRQRGEHHHATPAMTARRLDTGHLPRPEQPGRPDQEHQQHHRERRHAAQPAAEKGQLVLIAGREHGDDTDDQPADHRAAR